MPNPLVGPFRLRSARGASTGRSIRRCTPPQRTPAGPHRSGGRGAGRPQLGRGGVPGRFVDTVPLRPHQDSELIDCDYSIPAGLLTDIAISRPVEVPAVSGDHAAMRWAMNDSMASIFRRIGPATSLEPLPPGNYSPSSEALDQLSPCGPQYLPMRGSRHLLESTT